MHEAGLVELSHRRVDKRVACFTVAPGLEDREGVFPVYICIFGFERLVHARYIFFLSRVRLLKAKLRFQKKRGDWFYETRGRWQKI